MRNDSIDLWQRFLKVALELTGLFVRLFEASGIVDGGPPPGKAERRRVATFVAVLCAGAAGLYALAKFVGL